MMITSKTKLACLIGNPVGHSISPLIHNTLAEKMGIDMVYTSFAVEDENVGAAVNGAHAFGYKGMNVTVPHKCNVIPFLKEIDPLAQKIGAVNTLVPCEGGFKGYNTDIIGLARELSECGVTIAGNEVIIIGAGGASRSIVYLCADLGATRIWLLNRSVDKAEALAAEVNTYFGQVVVPLALDEFKKIPHAKYPVIQTSSVGMHPKTGVAPIMDEEFYELVSVGVDIICNPAETEFMKLCKRHNAQAYNGLKMLLYQGVAAFELWNEVKVSQELSDYVYGLMQAEMGMK